MKISLVVSEVEQKSDTACGCAILVCGLRQADNFLMMTETTYGLFTTGSRQIDDFCDTGTFLLVVF